DFDGFLGAMDHRHRKKVRQERTKLRNAGIEYRVLHGDEAGEEDIAAIHHFYLQTFADYGNTPALTRDFLQHLARAMPRQLVLVLACLDGAPVAGALNLRGGDTLYGRYWGSDVSVPGLHFEACYYQGIEYCLREGLSRFEPGAQGVHKIARGFLPAIVRSRHWIADARFAGALRDWCADESEAVLRHAAILSERSPFRAAAWWPPRRSCCRRIPARLSRLRRRRCGCPKACWRSAATCLRSACSMPIATASSRGPLPGSPCCGGARIRGWCSARMAC